MYDFRFTKHVWGKHNWLVSRPMSSCVKLLRTKA